MQAMFAQLDSVVLENSVILIIHKCCNLLVVHIVEGAFSLVVDVPRQEHSVVHSTHGSLKRNAYLPEALTSLEMRCCHARWLE
jgi:hypothetical protein